MSIPYESRKSTDIIPPEDFPRLQRDRPFRTINDLFLGTYGPEQTPLQASQDWLRAAGYVALLDVGCGTTHTLLTWRRTITKLAPCDPSDVKITGVSRYDYSKESHHRATEEAHAAGQVEYLVGDAVAQLKKQPKHSMHVGLAFNSLIHMDKADEVLEQMVRVTAPGGSLFFNISLEQNMSDAPVMEYIYWLQENGCETDEQFAHVQLPTAATDYVLCRIRIPS